MATVPTFEELVRAGTNEALSLDTRLTQEVIATPGSDVNVAFASQGAMAEKVAAYAQGEINATRLRTASSVSEEALEQFGASEFGGELRQGPESAVVPLLWTREPGGGAITIASGTLVSTAGGVTFETVVDLSFGAGVVGPLEVFGLATTAGQGGNVGLETITEVLSQVPDPTLTVINDEPASGGLPEQSVEDYEAQLQTVFERARRGTLGAIEAAAASTPGVVSARAYEILTIAALETGRVVVQVLGGGGTTNRALAARVLARVREFRAAGVPPSVQPLNPLNVTIVAQGLVIDADANLSPNEVLQQGSRGLVALGESLQVGATLEVAEILGVLARETPGLSVPKGSLLEPADDVEPGDGEYLVITLDDITLTAIAGA